jgi:DNA-binding response OmpR family regulator
MIDPGSNHVLIIEDDFVIALDLEATMARLGFEDCSLASNADGARLAAMRDPPDVALVDVCLEGGREGIEVARWLREMCGATVVFVTGCNDEDTVERIHERVPGAPVVPKPVYGKRLAAALEGAAP